MELISNNEVERWQRLDESGLEGCNKILRKIRIEQSRKPSQHENLTDTISRMWVGSDPCVQEEREKTQPFCKHCNVRGHGTRYCRKLHDKDGALTFDDYLFDMLTVEDA